MYICVLYRACFRICWSFYPQLSRVKLKSKLKWIQTLWMSMFNSSHWLKFNSKGDDLSEMAFDWWGSDWDSGPLFYTKWLLVQCGKPPVSSTCQATMLLPSFGSHESEILGLSSVCATILSMYIVYTCSKCYIILMFQRLISELNWKHFIAFFSL